MYNYKWVLYMEQYYGIILTFISVLFFLIGGLISIKIKQKEKVYSFSISLTFVVIINLLIGDLIPEISELVENYELKYQIILVIIGVGAGIFLLKILDSFIPDHHHEHYDFEKNKKEHISHQHHIGTLTLISLVLHNFLEGFAIAGMAFNDIAAGIMICISVALHNIPLGTTIFSSIDMKKNKSSILILALSSFIGGLIFFLIGSISPLVIAVVSLITMGMLIYISLLELLPELWQNKGKKECLWGIIIGLVIVIISIIL